MRNKEKEQQHLDSIRDFLAERLGPDYDQDPDSMYRKPIKEWLQHVSNAAAAWGLHVPAPAISASEQARSLKTLGVPMPQRIKNHIRTDELLRIEISKLSDNPLIDPYADDTRRGPMGETKND
ncbi:hypothetical protein [Morganella phage Mecenats66]|nr:hypothetical protein [Morganella phage Mecenats66]